MAVLATLGCEVQVEDVPGPRLGVEVAVVDVGGLEIEVELDATPAVMARAEGRTQIVGWRVYLDGNVVPSARIKERSCSVTLTLGALGSWSLEAPAPSPFGSPVAHLGAPPGRRRVDIALLYLTSTGLHEVRLVTDGIVDSERRTLRSVSLQGTDAGGRYDGRKATVVLPPGHGLARGQVVSRILAEAGLQQRVIPPGPRMDKAVQLVDVDALQAARDLARVDGLALSWDRFGVLTAYRDGFDPSRRVDFTVTPALLQRGEITFTSRADVTTRQTLTGTAQITREECGRRTSPPQRVDTWGDYAPVAAAYQQDIGGTLTSTGLSAVEAFRLKSRVETIRELACGDLVSEIVLTYGWYNPQAVRYTLNGDGSLGTYRGGVFLLAGAVEDDDSLAYQWPAERFVLTGISITTYHYDDRGFLVRTLRRTQTPRFTLAALKSRDNPGQIWEEQLFDVARLVTGNKAGVVETSETMPVPHGITGSHETEIEEIVFTVTDDGYVSRQDRRLTKWWASTGSLYLFAGDEVRATVAETLHLFETETITYVAEDGQAGHGTVREFRAGDEKPQIETQSGLDGYLPTAQRRQNSAPEAEAYPAGLPASRLESQAIEATAISYPLESAHGQRDGGTRSEPWAEDVGELLAIGEREIREGAAVEVTCTLPCNAFTEPAWRVRFEGFHSADPLGYGPGVPFDMWVRQVQHGGSPILTTLTGRHYLAAA